MQQTNFMCYNTLEVVKMLKINKKKIKEKFRKIKNDYLLVVSFIMSNLINGLILRGITVKNIFSLPPLFIDFGLLILISLVALAFKRKNRIKYYVNHTVNSELCKLRKSWQHVREVFGT